jgi:putative transposase
MIHEIVLQLVEKIRVRQPRVGTPKLYLMIKQDLVKHSIKMGRDQLHQMLLEYGLTIRKKRRGIKTTNSYHRFRRHPNLIKQLILDRPEMLWVSDITYITMGKGFCYLNLITDAYSHKIVGYWLDRTLSAKGTIQALKMAIGQRKNKDRKLIHHSDRGIQYCCDEYVFTLESNFITISMTENGDPYENPVAERVNGILKDELGLEKHFRRFDQAKNHLDKAVLIYNNERLHSSCSYLTPSSAHESEGKLKKYWKNYYKPKSTLKANEDFLQT